MTKEKIDFIEKIKKNATFVAFLTLVIIYAFSTSHLIRLFISFGFKCLNNDVHIDCAKLHIDCAKCVLSKIKKMKIETESAGHFLFLSLYFVSSI